MLRVSVSNTRPGMRLALDVRHPATGMVLLTEDFPLDEKTIQRLQELEVHHVWIQYPDTEQIKRYISPAIMEQHGMLVELMAGLFDRLHRDAHARLDYSHFRTFSRGLIESLVNEPLAASYLLELGGTGANRLRHAAEVCFLSFLLGLKLRGYLVQERQRLRPRHARNVINLGLGAMLHDIGTLHLPEQVASRYERTRDQSDPRWQTHTELGFQIVAGSIDPSAAGVVLHHHQYYDGSGFPELCNASGWCRTLAGRDIHVFARIVCAADHFDRLRHPPAGPVMPRVRVLRQMIDSPLTPRFDPVVLAALLKVVPAYTPGSMVTLSSGEHAVVTSWDPADPCRPVVRPLTAPDPTHGGVDEQSGPIDLVEHDDICIVAHEEAHVGPDNFSVPDHLVRLLLQEHDHLFAA